MGEQKGGSVVSENPKRGISENFRRIQRGSTEICLGGRGGGRDRESHQKVLGGSLQRSNIQRGDRLNLTLGSKKSSPAPSFVPFVYDLTLLKP